MWFLYHYKLTSETFREFYLLSCWIFERFSTIHIRGQKLKCDFMTALNTIFFFSGSKKEDILSGTPNFSNSVEYQVIGHFTDNKLLLNAAKCCGGDHHLS